MIVFEAPVVPVPVTFSISDTEREWSGAPTHVTVVSTPPGVPMNITYSGSSSAPTDAGTYAVLVSSASPGHIGAETATLFVRARLTVANPPGGGATGGGLFLPGELAAIGLSPAPWRVFSGWSFTTPSGGATLTGPFSSTSNAVRIGARSLTVSPSLAWQTFQVTVETSPVAAGGSTLPSGVFTANATQPYALTAAQGSGDWYFSGWSVVSGPATLTANTPTDADPAPVAQVSVTGDAVIRANYTPKAPTLISFGSPGEGGRMPLASAPYTLQASADSGAPVSFTLLSTAPAGIATLAGSTLTHRSPPLPGAVNLRLSSPATRTHLAGSLDASYVIADGAVGLVFRQASPLNLALDASQQGSANLTPILPNDYSEPQYLSAAQNPAHAERFMDDGRLLAQHDILDKIHADPSLKGQMANWLAAQGVQTDYVLALNGSGGGSGTGTGTGGGGNNPPTVTSLPGTGSPGQQVIYQGVIWTWQFIPSGPRDFDWVPGRAAP